MEKAPGEQDPIIKSGDRSSELSFEVLLLCVEWPFEEGFTLSTKDSSVDY